MGAITICVELVSKYKKPVMVIADSKTKLSALIDTGAHNIIFFGNESDFKMQFPNAKPTKYATVISGLGGTNKVVSPIWQVPVLSFHDMNSNNAFHMYNVYIVIYNTSKDYSYDMIIGGTLFNKVDFGFVNRTPSKYMTITFDRDVYCVCNIANTRSKKLQKDSLILITSTQTFLQDDVAQSQETEKIREIHVFN